ncbi:MAG: hypothetical protein K2H89_10260, partial [Oscillospiraceae bacterium]|nr:hypothetical protein [Oscillospiraceae bacterium]
MKRLLSTLTALCMCASMSVGMLPASALSAISTDDTAVVRADSGLMARAGESDAHNKGYEWCVEDATFDPANPPKGNVIQMPITVWNDPGTAGVNAKILVDGKELTDSTTDDFPFTLALMKQGSAYSFETFMPNPAIGDFGMAVAGNGGEPQTAEQGGQGLVIAFKLKDGAELTPGKEYKIGLTSEENSFVGANKVVLNPQPILTAGTLKIAGGEDTTTAPTPQDTTAPTPQDTTAPAPQDTTAPVAENNHDNGYEWCVEDAKFDPKNPPKGNVIQMPITVWNDPGTAGVNAKILVDGKELTDSTTDDFPFTLALMKQGSAYSFETFMPNPAIGDFGMAVAGNGGEPQTAEQGGQGLTIAFKLKDGAELTPGKKYKIELTAEENSFVGANKVVLNPQPILTPGYLIIAGEDDPIEPPISEDYKWYVEDAEFDPKTDENVLANIKVAGDPGTFAYYFFITIDGKSPADADFPFELKAVKGGDAYPQASGFAGNIAGGKAAGTTENPSAEKNGFATDNGTAVTYVLAAKEGVTYTPGTKYEVKIANSKFTNYEKQVLFPDLESGFITIKGEAQTTDAPTDAPTEPDATDPPFEHKQKEVDAKWIIGHDTVAPGAEVTIPVYVEGNTDGFNSYIADIKAADGPVLKDGSNGKISANLNFVENPDKLIFSATNFTKDGEMVKGDGDVFYMTFTAPTKPGTYALDFENLEIYDIDMVQLIPKTENGWIEVKADETDFEHKKQDTAAKWVIGKVEIDAGTTTARVPVSVQGASKKKDGINSYIAKIKQDAGPKATGAEAGTAYAELGLQQNLNDLDLIFAGTNSDQKKNITAADGDVFYIDFEIPADAAPGTTYNLKFADLELENMDMVQLIPTTEDGWIKIKEAETTTTEPIEVGDAGMWVIGTATVAPGEKVTIPVTVTGDKNGINSFIMKMGNPGKGGVTPTPESAEKGNA